MPTDIDEVARRVVAAARPGEDIEALAVHTTETEIRAYEGDVESVSAAETAGVGIRVVTGGRVGFAWAGSLEDGVVAETLEEARRNAELATPDEHAGLATPDGVAPAPLRLLEPSLVSTPTDTKVELALELERATRAADPRITGVESAEYADWVSRAALVTTTGIDVTEESGAAYLVAFALASDGDVTQTGYSFSVGRSPGDLDPAAAAADTARRAVRMLGATQPSTRRTTVVLEPRVTAQLLGIIGTTLSADNVQKGRSMFAGRMGETVASPLITLVDDPTDARAWGAAPYDDEGLATRSNAFIDGGVLTGYAHDSTTARRAGTTSNACARRGGFKGLPTPGCRALRLAEGTTGPEELIAGIDDGVLIVGVSGLHSGVNPVSGDFSTGAEGILIEGGRLTRPVREFTIASTLQRILLDVRAVGSDVEWLPGSAAGVTLVVGDVTVSGS